MEKTLTNDVPESLLEKGKENLITVERLSDRILISINNQENKNSIETSTLSQIKSVIESVENNPEIKSIVFHAGNSLNPKKEAHFSQGASIPEMLNLHDKNSAYDFSRFGQEVMNIVENSHKNTIAAITGFCVGGGLELSMACKYRIASKGSILLMPEKNIGIIPGWGGAVRMPLIVGEKNAKEIFRWERETKNAKDFFITAEKALEYGLIDEIVTNPLEEANLIIDGKRPLPKSKAFKNTEQFLSYKPSGDFPETYEDEADMFSLYFKDGAPKKMEEVQKEEDKKRGK